MDKGEVWIYFDRDSRKNRPAIVIGNSLLESDNDAVIVKLTSQDPRTEFDIALKNWKDYGLNNPSTVRCSKLFTIKEHELKYRTGLIEDEVVDEIKKTVAKYILED